MSDFMNTFFGPLDKSVCVYFLALSMLFFFLLIFVLGMEIFYAIRHLKGLNARLVTNGVLILFNLFLSYFLNRVFYNMCTKTMN